MNMLKMKWIGSAALLLGAVACEPLPVYPQTDAPRRQYPPRYQDPRDRNPSYYGGERDPRPDYGSGYGEERPPVERVPRRDEHPTAERTDNPNRVISPYAPYNVIDVEGFRSGQLAKDPSNGKIFRIP